jgi:hypothetical protein
VEQEHAAVAAEEDGNLLLFFLVLFVLVLFVLVFFLVGLVLEVLGVGLLELLVELLDRLFGLVLVVVGGLMTGTPAGCTPPRPGARSRRGPSGPRPRACWSASNASWFPRRPALLRPPGPPSIAFAMSPLRCRGTP